MSDQAMIESSMIIHRDSLHELLALANADALENLVVSDALLRMAEDVDVLVRILGRRLEIPNALIDRVAIREFVPVLRDRVRVYRREGSSDHPMYQNLIQITENEWVTRVFFEEWEFLTSHSWLFAKARKALDDIVEAGSSAFHSSRKKFEQMTRRLLNKEVGAPLSPNDKVKAAAKWVAMGGGPVLSLFESISGTAVNVMGSIFILSDP